MKAARIEIARALCDGRRHLLILDNLEPSDNSDAPWDTAGLALSARCAVIITTREQRYRTGSRRSFVWASSPSRMPGHAAQTVRGQVSRVDRGRSRSLAVHLGRHALAVDLAAAWLHINPGLTPGKLLSQIKASDEAMLAVSRTTKSRARPTTTA